jgi:hypothetical protein
MHRGNPVYVIIIVFLLVVNFCVSYADTTSRKDVNTKESFVEFENVTKNILPWIATIVGLGVLIYAQQQVRVALKYNKQCAYQEGMKQLTELKARFVDHEELVEQLFEGSAVFDQVRGHLSGKHFLMLSNYFYKAEQMWSLRRKGLLDEGEWYTISSLLRNYLTIEDIRFVFYNYIVNKNVKTHQLRFIDDLKNILGENENEFDINRLVGNNFDPYKKKWYKLSRK